jgi:protein SCO1
MRIVPICPTHVAVVVSALRTLPAEVANQVKVVVFVTTDPKRDNPRLLRTWLNHFDKHIVGLTGDENAIQAAQLAANLPIASSAPSYEHSAFVLAYTKDNLAHVIYPSGIQQSDWIHDLPRLVTENWVR